MTSIRNELVTCILCGGQTPVRVLMSTSSFGSPDLDLRPSELARSTISMWVQRCASCGYCAPNISEAMPDTRKVVESTEYRALLEHSGFPELARSFLCSSLVFEKCGKRVAAARAAVEAAWACDDGGAVAESIHCRVLTVRLLRKCSNDRDSVPPDPHSGRAVIADLLRRAKLFDDAIAVIDDVVEGAPGRVAKMLAFSRLRALARDPGRYTVDDAMSTTS